MTLAPRPPYSAGQAMAAYPASASFLFQVRMRSSASGDSHSAKLVPTTAGSRFSFSQARNSARNASASGG